MTQTTLPDGFDLEALKRAVAAEGVRGVQFWYTETSRLLEIIPDLTPEQEARLNTLIARIQAAQTDYAQVETLRADLLGYRDNAEAYLALTSPTNAQSVAAIKSLIRICGLIIRLLFLLIDFVTQKAAVQGFR